MRIFRAADTKPETVRDSIRRVVSAGRVQSAESDSRPTLRVVSVGVAAARWHAKATTTFTTAESKEGLALGKRGRMAEPGKKRKVKFPYETFEEALKDGFKKIGGRTGAFRSMAKGYKTIVWRRRAEVTAKEVGDIQATAQAKASGVTLPNGSKKKE